MGQNLYRRNAKALYLFMILLMVLTTAFTAPRPKLNDTIHYQVNKLLELNKKNVITAVVEDNQGFLWMGTGQNLYRYDGAQLKVFRHSPLDTTSLIEYSITSLKLESDSLLWVATIGGLCKLNLNSNNEHFDRYPFPDLYDDFNNNYLTVKTICEDDKNNLWLAGDFDCLLKFNKNTGRYTPVPLDSHFKVAFIKLKNKAQSTLIYKLEFDPDGVLWIAGILGLYKYDIKNELLTRIETSSHQDPTPDFIYSMYKDKSGTFWIGAKNGLYSFDPTKELFSLQFNLKVHTNSNSDAFQYPGIRQIKQDSKGNLWLRTFGAIYSYHHDKGLIDDYNIMETTQSSFSEGTALSVTKNDIILYANFSELNCLQPKINDFHTIQVQKDNVNSISSNSITALSADNDSIVWIGTIDGLNKLNLNTKQITTYRNDPHNESSLNSDRIKAIYRDSKGILWVGTEDAGLCRLVENTSPPSFIRYNSNPQNAGSISNDFIGFIKEFGDAFVITIVGDVYNRKNDNFYYQKDFDININSVPKNELQPGPSPGEYWHNTWNGIFRFIPPYKVVNDTLKIGKIFHIVSNVNEDQSLNCNKVHYVLKSEHFEPGTIWLGTWGGGINKMIYEPITGTDSFRIRFDHFTVDDGLCSNYISAMQEDDLGNLWVATDNGLSVFDPKNKTFKNYTTEHGLPSNYFNQAIAACKTDDGRMFFGTDNGVVWFYPKDQLQNQIIPQLIFTDFKINNRSVINDSESPLTHNINKTKKLILPYQKNSFGIDFNGVTHVYQNKNQYKFLLCGFDKDTVDAGTKNFAEYKNLPPGDYTFWVNAANSDGFWNPKGRTLNIIIKPPWYRTALAYIVYFLIFALLLNQYIRIRTQRLKRNQLLLEKKVEQRTIQYKKDQTQIEGQRKLLEQKNKEIVELDKLKTRFFTNISHEFRTPLTLIQGPVEDMLEQDKLPSRAKKTLSIVLQNTRRLLDLVNQLLQISSIESRKLKLKLSENNPTEHLKKIAGSFSSAAESKGILFKTHIPSQTELYFYDSDKIEKIVFNLLSNAVKYTPEGGQITLNVQLKAPKGENGSHYLQVSVSDTGIGIPQKDLDKIFELFYRSEEKEPISGTGIGLSLTRDLVKIMHGDISVSSSPGSGSTFHVVLPLGYHHFKKSEYILIKKPKGEVMVDNEGERNGKESNSSNTVLIVEDNADVRDYISGVLRSQFKIHEAIDGQAGLKLAIEILPDIVITDLMMPRMNGNEFCRQLKTNDNTSHIPVIMLTAKGELEDKIQGYKVGADEYLIKPFNSRELITRINNLLSQRKKLREKYCKEILVQPGNVKVQSMDEEFLERVMQTIEANIDEETFNTSSLGAELNMSHSTLFRKIQYITNMSPTEFIRTVRLKRAAELIIKHFGNISEIAFEVGFSNPSYFSKCFKKAYGQTPIEYQQSNAKNLSGIDKS